MNQVRGLVRAARMSQTCDPLGFTDFRTKTEFSDFGDVKKLAKPTLFRL
jgi:hypothetical protein